MAGSGNATISGQDSSWNGQHGVWVGQFTRGQLDILTAAASMIIHCRLRMTGTRLVLLMSVAKLGSQPGTQVI
ncbi:hypothetical protein HED49_20005 [Ochrobactrum daejeonense]|nr:hypothetical protein [Brucella daejeonensis]